jgi:hypothetical protein
VDDTPILQALETLNTYKGEHMPNDISPSCEEKDQKSDSPTKGTSRSNGKGHDFATRPESYQYAAHHDLQRRGGDEQAYDELKRARKGKMLVVSDETSRHSDTQPSSEYSSGSDSETNALQGASPSDKIILSNKPTRDNPGLLGGGDNFRDMDRFLQRMALSNFSGGPLGNETGKAIKDVLGLVKSSHDYSKRGAETRKNVKYRSEFDKDLYQIQDKFTKLDALNFNDFKRECPEHADYELFDQQKKFLKKDYERTIVIMGKLGPQDWYYMEKYDKSREKKFSDLSSGEKLGYAAKWLADGQKGRSDKQCQKEFSQALDEFDQKWRKLNRLTFEDFKREYPEHADDELFDQQRKSLMEDCNRKFDIILKSGPEGWQRMKKEEKRRARRSN